MGARSTRGLDVRVGTDLAALADDLADGLASPVGEVLEPELVIVPTPGIGQWLQPRLARRLGATSLGDGICANVELRLVSELLRRLDPTDEDPWSVGAMTVALLGELLTEPPIPAVRALRTADEDASAFTLARGVADLLDQLFRWRPDVAERWLDDEPDPRAALLRRLAERSSAPPPHRALEAVLQRLRDGDDDGVELPERVHLFGSDTLAGGPRMAAVLEALGRVREVRLHLVVPSVARFEALCAQTERWVGPAPERRRGGETGDPLLRSWGTATGDAARLLAQVVASPGASVASVPGPDGRRGTLLAALHETVVGTEVLRRAPDASIGLHGCVGTLRQVEVARDAVLHALQEDPTLEPSDVLVLCSDLPRFAPYLDAVLGDPQGAPRLPYVVRDRAVSRAVASVAGLDAALRLLTGRVPRSAVLDFLRLPGVRARLRLDDDDVDLLSRWSSETGVHWGLDGAHRTASGLPEDFDAGTWRRALDRLLAGVALPAGAGGTTLSVRAVDVGQSLDLVGSMCELVDALARLRSAAAGPRSVAGWSAFSREVAAALLDDRDETAASRRALDELLEGLEHDGQVDTTPVPFFEFRALYADRAQQVRDVVVTGPGGVTVTSFVPLRNVPARMVVLLGLDESSLERTRSTDVAFGPPRVGDRDPRTELRAALLAAVLAATDRLIVTYESRDVVSNEPLAAATVLTELREAIGRACDGDASTIEREHPRHAHGDEELRVGGSAPFSFDRGALARARDLRAPLHDERALRGALDGARTPASRVSAAALGEFLRAPQSTFLRESLGVRMPPHRNAPDDELPTSLDDLSRYAAVGALVEAGLDELDGDVDEAAWDAFAERWARRPDGPLSDLPGRLAERELAGRRGVSGRARELRAQVERAWGGAAGERVDVEVRVGDEVVVAGVEVFEGTRTVRWTASTNRFRTRLLTTVDLLCLTAAHPETRWRGAYVWRKDDRAQCEKWSVPGEDAEERAERAQTALAALLSLRRMGLASPIPLFFKVSEKIIDQLKHDKVPGPAELLATGSQGWLDYRGFGDATEDAVRYCFDASYEELSDLEVQPGDPVTRIGHGGSRLLCFTLGMADGLCLLDGVGTSS